MSIPVSERALAAITAEKTVDEFWELDYHSNCQPKYQLTK